MAIFKHPDGSHRRYPPQPSAPAQQPADDEYTNDAHWRPMDKARPGIQIHRDGKTMRNVAPTPRAWLNALQADRAIGNWQTCQHSADAGDALVWLA